VATAWRPSPPSAQSYSFSGQRDPRLPVGAPGYALGAGRKDSSWYRRSRAFAVIGRALGRSLATLSNLLNLKKVLLPPWRKYSFSTAADDCHLTAADDCDLIVDPVDLWARGAACLAIQHLVNSARI
jgi:hypothetical protein